MSATQQKTAAKKLHQWYKKHGRHALPWRKTHDPYAIWISEIMLQQTQVATVKGRYYEPFLARFPTLASLAAANLNDVLELWEGLGYYRRARHLHEAAQAAAPTMPNSVEGLLALKGIGKNTAHAIASFAHGTPVPVMEANVKRILSRMHAATHPTEKELWHWAAELLNKDDPFTHNQAMMDIGATLCTPKAPQCAQCPLAIACKGQTTPEFYPEKKAKKHVPTRNKAMLAIYNAEGDYWLSPRTGEFLHGLHGLPEINADSAEAKSLANTAKHIGTIHQTYSHFKLHAELYSIPQTQAQHILHPIHNQGTWHNLKAARKLPLSRADAKALALLAN